jgi:hypothetical protein
MTYAAEIAKDVRQAVRALKDTGQLTGLPKGARITVSSDSGSMYAAVTVNIANVTPEWVWKYGRSAGQLTPVAEQVVNRLRAAAAKAANGRGWGSVRIADGGSCASVGQGWTPAGWQSGQG